MKKSFCDKCGNLITPDEGIIMVEIKAAFWVKESTQSTSARESNLDFCSAACFGLGMEAWLKKQMDEHRVPKPNYI